MVTTRAAQAMGLSHFTLAEGSPANWVVLDVPTILQAFRYHAAPDYVVSNGRLVDQDQMAGMANLPL